MPALPTTSTTTTTQAGPDLAGNGWMSPGSAPSGSKIAIEVTVKNFGNASATAPWYDYILISNDLVFGNDQAIAVVQHMTNLAAGASYTQIIQPTLPAVPPGTYYLFLHTDPTNAVAESNEQNNIGGFVQIVIN
jgi:subtilase family serine protease